MSQDERKRQAARSALDLLPESGIVGLGTGSTATHFIDGVGELVAAGRRLRAVATSEQSRAQAESLGIELLPDEGPWAIDLCVDGADEVSTDLQLIKGGGGCQLREKIVNHASRVNVIVVDESKLSNQLGEKWPVPLEVLDFAHRATAAALASIGRLEPRLKNGVPWRTDSGNYIYDLHVGPIEDPAALDAQLLGIPGVIETGLFIGRADRVIVAGADGVRTLVR